MREQVIAPGWDRKHLTALSEQLQLNVSPEQIGSVLQSYYLERSTVNSHLAPLEIEQTVQRVPANRKAQTLTLAREIMQRRFSYRGVTVSFDEVVDWGYRPDENIDWTWDLNRHYCLVVLGRAFAYTKDEMYATHAVTLLKSWMAQNPPRVNSPVWRPFEISTRLNTWLWTFFLLLESDYFACHGLANLLVGMAVQTQFLLENLEYHIRNNHLLLEAKTLAMIGVLFPEFQDALLWQQTGLKVVWQEFEAQVCLDGVHAERSTQYHLLVGSELWELFHVLERNELPKPVMVEPRFAKMIEFARVIIKPDHTIPLFGDAARTDEHIRFDLRWAAPGMPVDDQVPGEETFWLMKQPFSETDQFIPTSADFPHGGYYIMRSSGKKTEPYLVFDCGPFGHKPVPSHGHADALSFELFAYGETLITDCGAFRYHAPAQWRKYFRGTSAHNTLLVDNQDQSILVGVRQVERPAEATAHRWITSDDLDLVDSSHNGYTRLAEPIIHRRKIIFVKPDYWLVLDEVQGFGQHRLDWFYHLMPQAKTELDVVSGKLYCEIGQAGLVIEPLSPDEIDMKNRLITGDKIEYQGWVSLESGQKEPAPVLNYCCNVEVPLRFGTLLYPHKADQSPSLNVHLLRASSDMWALRVQNGVQHDLILCAYNGKPGTLFYDEWNANASLLIVRQVAPKKYRIILTDGSFVSRQDQIVFQKKQPLSVVSITYG
jgi:uncharacterized heparinase superfamily protein